MLRVGALGRRVAAHPRAAVQYALGHNSRHTLQRLFSSTPEQPEPPVPSFSFGRRRGSQRSSSPAEKNEQNSAVATTASTRNEKVLQLVTSLDLLVKLFDDPIYARYQRELPRFPMDDPKFSKFRNGLRTAFLHVEPWIKPNLQVLFDKMFEKGPLATCVLIYAFLMKLTKNRGSIGNKTDAYIDIERNAGAFFEKAVFDKLHKNDKIFLLICTPEKILKMLSEGDSPNTKKNSKLSNQEELFRELTKMSPKLRILLALRVIEILPNLPLKLAQRLKQDLMISTVVAILAAQDPAKIMDELTLAGLAEIWLIAYEQASELHPKKIPDDSLFRFRPIFHSMRGTVGDIVEDYKMKNVTLQRSKPDNLLEHFCELAVQNSQRSSESANNKSSTSDKLPNFEKQATLCLLSSMAAIRDRVLDSVGSRQFFDSKLKQIGAITKEDVLPIFKLLAAVHAESKHELYQGTVTLANDVFESFVPIIRELSEARSYERYRTTDEVRRDEVIKLLLAAVSENPPLSNSFVAEKINSTNFELLARLEDLADQISDLEANKLNLETELPILMQYMPRNTDEDIETLLQSHFLILRDLISVSDSERSDLQWLKKAIAKLCSYLHFQLEIQLLLSLDCQTAHKVFKKPNVHSKIQTKISLALKRLTAIIDGHPFLPRIGRLLSPSDHLILRNLVDANVYLPRLMQEFAEHSLKRDRELIGTKNSEAFLTDLVSGLSKHLRIKNIASEFEKCGTWDSQGIIIEGKYGLVISNSMSSKSADGDKSSWTLFDRFESDGNAYTQPVWTHLSKQDRINISWMLSKKFSVLVVNSQKSSQLAEIVKQIMKKLNPRIVEVAAEPAPPKTRKPSKSVDKKQKHKEPEQEEIKEAARGLFGFSAEALGI